MSVLGKLQPTALWHHFEAICQIPHPSGKEEEIRDHLIGFASKHFLEFNVDNIGNLIIRKPATIGYEDKSGIILQSHLDMVPQKNTSTVHDFTKDPIRPKIVDGWVMATGTTLGADNGIGVAATMALLASKDIPHGPLEALFTIDEETGMTGAENLQPGVLKGNTLLNLDTEVEGEVYVGCAGGVDIVATGSYKQNTAETDVFWQKISVTGLLGGHSGCDIHLQRGNANLLMVRLLKRLVSIGIQVSSIKGGSLRNAISREAFATVCVPVTALQEFTSILNQVEKEAAKELAETDSGVTISSEHAQACDQVVMTKDLLRWLDAFHSCPHGVSRMSEGLEGVVETSNNLAIINVQSGKVTVECFARSLSDPAWAEIAERVASVFRLAGAHVVLEGPFPGWKPNMSSAALEKVSATYEEIFWS